MFDCRCAPFLGTAVPYARCRFSYQIVATIVISTVITAGLNPGNGVRNQGKKQLYFPVAQVCQAEREFYTITRKRPSAVRRKPKASEQLMMESFLGGYAAAKIVQMDWTERRN
ncbi:hypothetical protein A7K69_10985 [Parageobacillus thermoglucosidasius]|uniref:Uncharacterized protein n=1 Tax=Parageobacillus thermoglucosidasius TaxID=1426 RepID=A0A1B7KPB3_PARTM|nr:hypothetical protein A7K69_10985 [Parageobacillus thermoglucosidasius]